MSIIDLQMNPPVHPADTGFINKYAALSIFARTCYSQDLSLEMINSTLTYFLNLEPTQVLH